MTDNTTEPNVSWDTRRNWLRGVRYTVWKEYGPEPDQMSNLRTAIEQLPKFQNIQRQDRGRSHVIRALLSNAWQTELVLRMPSTSDHDDAYRLAIFWGPIQLYFGLYCAASAWLEARRYPDSPKKHRTTINELGELARLGYFPLPWGMACDDAVTPSYCGALPGYSPRAVRNTASPTRDNALDYVCQMVKRTRQRRLEERVSKWKNKNDKQRIMDAEKRGLDDFPPTTLFDFLLNLRERAQYGNTDFIAFGSSWGNEARKFQETLQRISAASMLLFEKLLVRTHGSAVIQAHADEFVTCWDSALTTVGKRRHLW